MSLVSETKKLIILKSNESKYILKNTAILYIRLIISLIVAIYSSRILLQSFGEVDYGIFLFIVGIAGFYNIFQTNLSITSLRFISYSYGAKDKTTNYFNTILIISISFGLIGFVLMQAGIFYLFEDIVNIPIEKIKEAKILLQLTLVTTLLMIITVPFDSFLYSMEDIYILSLIDVSAVLIKLFFAFFLVVSSFNSVVFYALFLLLIQFCIFYIKIYLFKKKYSKISNINFNHFDKVAFKEMMIFLSWNFLSSFSSLAVNQIKALLINSFFNVKVNLSESLSTNLTSQIGLFTSTLSSAILPSLMKSEGGGDREKVLNLTYSSIKYTIFLFGLIAVPVFFETHFLLKLWLVKVPEYLEDFVKLSLIAIFIQNFTFQITNAIKAQGRIGFFQVVESFLYISIMPMAYFAFKWGYGPSSIYYFLIVVSLINTMTRLKFAKNIISLNITSYLKMAVMPVLLPILISVVLLLPIRYLLAESVFRLLFGSFIYCLSLCCLYWYFVLDSVQRLSLLEYVKEKIKIKSI